MCSKIANNNAGELGRNIAQLIAGSKE